MEIVSDDASLTHVRLRGRLDVNGVDQIETQFANAVGGGGRPAMIDIEQVSFLASMGIRMLVESARRLKRGSGARIVLYAPNRVVRESIERCALFDMLPIVADAEAARAMLGT